MHNRKVFPLKNLNYGASKSSATQNTATNPADLADGAIGVYGIHKAGATNPNKTVLIIDGGAEAAGVVPAASFVGDQIVIAMGVGSGPSQLSNYIDKPGGLKRSAASKYTAPVLGVNRIGYNGTVGTSYNLPGTILKGDDFSISIVDRNAPVAGFRNPYQKVNISIPAALNDTAFSLTKKWIASASLKSGIFIDKTKIKMIHNGTGSAFANSATVSAVNGATSLTTSAAHGVGVGDYVDLNGDLYQAVTGTTGTTLVLDRPYQGPTATIANANTLDLGAVVPTAVGIEVTDDQVGRNITIAADGLLVNTTLKQQTAPLGGSGTEAQVKALELEALPKKGSHDQLTSYAKLDTIRASGTYDLYILTIQNSNHPTGQQGSVFNVINYLTLAFPSDIADTTNLAQSDFEDIMTSLFGATFPAISA